MAILRRAALFSLLALTAPASAQEPLVRVTVSPEEVPVGEAAEIEVTVLVPTWFPRPPVYPTFELANTITRLPPNSSYPTSERVGGETWSGIVRNYQVFPLLGAAYRWSGQVLSVTYADPETRRPVTVEVTVPEVELRGAVPAGAEGLNPYVAGRRLTLQREIEGDIAALETGDALAVHYVAELDGMPAVFLPPLVAATEVPGVAVYPDQPVVEEEAPARRSEKLTFVFEAGGEFVIPGARLEWWNREAGQIEAATVEPLTVSVAGDPLPVPEEEPPPEPIDWRRIVISLVALIVAWRLLARLTPRVRSALAAARERRLASEEHAFGQLEKALSSGDRHRSQAALQEWLERIAPGLSLTDFAARYGDDELREELRSVSRALYREASGEIHLKRLADPLRAARRNARREQHQQVSHALPPLNP